MLRLKNVEKKYNDFSLKCSLEVEPGQIIGLVGRNGAGKSTTFKIALGLLAYQAGEVEIFGKPLEELTEKHRQRLGVSLSESGFSEYLTIQDIVPMLATFYSQFQKDFFLEKCAAFQLPLNKAIKDFSTGMKARLKILIAISHQASLLILDEPTAGLDVVAREEILRLLQEYMEQDETRAILISSHISKDLEQLCDALYFINQGTIILREDTDVLLDEYGLLKMTEEQYAHIEKDYLIAVKRTSFGYQGLTKQRQFYVENYPEIVMEKTSVDEITLMIMGGLTDERLIY
ncbi:ABC transporter ATP-binding protein [Enterococcus pallens]|uniref:ABC transporter domain-containing protein n=1 Tax=Enterococcus pallens ATCC BAA-351 TaxID=1158607 RepID=R2QK14_9ENTE|nr:ABC transporter ATP-binding protein [Enterococcus pallens]EOH95508.1 hypothetical protein UAU_01470 [Enterococcus pallens ATCC BAA-351]EOU21355.1 hypothetical protein I588_02202 [Enterococcus pallens ATCC BAA-351]